MQVKHIPVIASVVASLCAFSASGAIIAGWSITTPFPTGAGQVPTGMTYGVGAADQGEATVGTSLISVHALAAATYTSPAGNGSTYGFSSNNWSIGDYYQATVSTVGYSGVSVSWDQTRSSTGPSSFELISSVDGGASWQTVLASYAVLQSGGGGAPGTWTTATYLSIYTNTASISGVDNASQLIIRFRSLVTTAAAGSNRIDNVIISGVPAPGAIALLGLAGLVSRRRR